MKVYIDIETRSAANLKLTGAYVYADHPTTEVTVVCWAVDSGPVQTWLPLSQPLPPELVALFSNPAATFVAHNVSFEATLLGGPPGQRFGLPVVPLERWDCTASRAACYGLPRTLEGAAAALGLAVQKDKTGHALMLQMCKPRAVRAGTPAEPGQVTHPVYFDDAPRMARLAAYCVRDVEVEREIDRVLPPLPPVELEAWRLTEAMNNRGIAVDTRLLLAVSLLVDDAELDVNARISTATGGAVPKVSNHAALTRWLVAQGIDDAEETGVGKQVVAALVEQADLDPVLRSVLVMRQHGGGSSSKKYRAILNRLSSDGRIRGVLVYCGASGTGRYSSRGAQLQNLPRGGSVRNVPGAIRDLLDGGTLAELEELHGPPLVLASELLRPVFVAKPGHWLARGDYSQIEARVLAWLSGADWKLDAFRAYDAGTGPDLYRIAASGIYGVEIAAVTKEQRQIGKVGELALGYGGGRGAFLAMARGYGVKTSEERAEEIKVAWRKANPEVSSYENGLWGLLDMAALDCMQAAPGAVIPVGQRGVSFRRNSRCMAMRLPSGRSVLYWTPRLKMVQTPWGAERLAVICRTENPMSKKWEERALYGGLLCENLTQATARELMVCALIEAERDGLRPVLTVHDECVCELEAASAREAAERVQVTMLSLPEWAAGLPIAADASAAQRYVKA